ncbi:MAG: hypothetical protein WBF08_00585 [Candidatus Bathyarchaeia archaeon]
MPDWIPNNFWFWVISLFFSFGSILLTYEIIKVFQSPEDKVPPYYLPLIILLPGGLSIATGNAEIPVLFFSSLLLLSVIRWQKWWITLISGFLAILTKPNALYMVPILLVYSTSAILRRDKKKLIYSILGILSVILGWIAWILFVDLNIGRVGSYWEAREMARIFVAGNPVNYFLELANSFAYSGNFRDQVRYTTGLIIPLINILIIGYVTFSKESHRLGQLFGNLTMLCMALLLGNPNKIIVYTTTIPGYFSVGLIMFHKIFNAKWLKSNIHKFVIAPIFILYCVLMLLFYVMGTPLGWYY